MNTRKQHFLCPNHAYWLAGSPKRAIQCWHTSIDIADALANENQWQAALPYSGCAYETADIIVSLSLEELRPHGIDENMRQHMFISSAKLTIKALMALDKHQAADQFCDSAIIRLNSLKSGQQKTFLFNEQIKNVRHRELLAMQ